MSIVQILYVVLSFIFLYILWKRRKYYLLAFKIKGPLGYPLIGMAHVLMRKEDILGNIAKYEQKYGNSLLYSWLGPMPLLVVLEPQIAQDILISPHCVNKGFMYSAMVNGTGDGLITLKEPEWSRQRKLINPALNHKVLVSLIPTFNKETNKLMKILDDYVGENGLDILEILQEYTLTITTQTTMGHNLILKNYSENVNLFKCYQCVQRNITEMAFSPWLQWTFLRVLLGIYTPYANAKKHIGSFIEYLVSKNMKEKSSKNSVLAPETEGPIIFIDLAMEKLKMGELTYKQVVDESNVLVNGAFETTANTITHILILLAMFPECQQKLFEEVKVIFPKAGDFEVALADLQELVYMDLVINEAMRLLAPVPMIAREATADVKLSNGVTLPAGIQIAIDIFNMQRRKDIWGVDAHTFNPEHFLPSNLEDKHSFSFIPFTKGIRNCIGWRYALFVMKIALSKLIRNYHFKTDFNFEDLHYVEHITLKFKRMPLLKLTRRLE